MLDTGARCICDKLADVASTSTDAAPRAGMAEPGRFRGGGGGPRFQSDDTRPVWPWASMESTATGGLSDDAHAFAGAFDLLEPREDMMVLPRRRSSRTRSMKRLCINGSRPLVGSSISTPGSCMKRYDATFCFMPLLISSAWGWPSSGVRAQCDPRPSCRGRRRRTAGTHSSCPGKYLLGDVADVPLKSGAWLQQCLG